MNKNFNLGPIKRLLEQERDKERVFVDIEKEIAEMDEFASMANYELSHYNYNPYFSSPVNYQYPKKAYYHDGDIFTLNIGYDYIKESIALSDTGNIPIEARIQFAIIYKIVNISILKSLDMKLFETPADPVDRYLSINLIQYYDLIVDYLTKYILMRDMVKICKRVGMDVAYYFDILEGMPKLSNIIPHKYLLDKYKEGCWKSSYDALKYWIGLKFFGTSGEEQAQKPNFSISWIAMTKKD